MTPNPEQPLAKMLQMYRASIRPSVGVREMARRIGTSPATLSRLERGLPCDIGTWLKVQDWLLGRGGDHGE